MNKGILRIAIFLIAALLNVVAAQASDYKGGYLGAKFGINNSTAAGTINAPSASTFAYGIQGGYLQGGYNRDLSAVTIGAGIYADFNSYEIHTNGVEYGSQAYGVDAKLGLPLDDWLLYAKIGYGRSSGTRDLKTVAGKSPNAALGFEYKIVSRWGAIVEYKYDSFSNNDNSTRIRNRTFSFGLNYYFDRPLRDEVVVAQEIDLGPEPELDINLDLSAPPPDIGAGAGSSPEIPPAMVTALPSVIAASKAPSVVTPVTPSEPESWTLLRGNKPFIVEGSNFASGSLILKPKVARQLDDVAGFSKKYPDAKLELVGYADNSGSAKLSQKFSLARAESVKSYLVKKGVAANRISTKGEGAINPMSDNTTKEGRTKNRRVEIHSVVKGQSESGVAAPDKVPVSVPVLVPVPVSASVTWKILLQDKPVLVNIEGTSFVSNSISENSTVDNQLDEVVEFARNYPDTRLELTGYTDSTGTAELNQKLSLARAKSVKKYLVKKGVAANRITDKGWWIHQSCRRQQN